VSFFCYFKCFHILSVHQGKIRCIFQASSQKKTGLGNQARERIKIHTKMSLSIFGGLAVMTGLTSGRPITLRRQFSLVLPFQLPISYSKYSGAHFTIT